MRVLVTGAGGFLGRHIVAALLAHKHAVIALDRAFDAGWRAEWGKRVPLLETDAADLPALEVDAVIHAAAVTAQHDEVGMTPEAHLRANLDPALRILEWARERAKVILLSSSAVIGGYERPISEFVLPQPSGTYAIAKAALEWIAQTWASGYQRDVVCLRLSSLYGEGEIARQTRPRVSLVARYAWQALMTGKIAVYHPEIARDWTYARDIGEVCAALLEIHFSVYPVMNAASEQVRTGIEVAEAVRALLPNTEIQLMAGDEPGFPPPTRRGALLNDRLYSELGFNAWTPFEVGIARVVVDAQRRLERQR